MTLAIKVSTGWQPEMYLGQKLNYTPHCKENPLYVFLFSDPISTFMSL